MRLDQFAVTAKQTNFMWYPAMNAHNINALINGCVVEDEGGASLLSQPPAVSAEVL